MSRSYFFLMFYSGGSGEKIEPIDACAVSGSDGRWPLFHVVRRKRFFNHTQIRVTGQPERREREIFTGRTFANICSLSGYASLV